ncbi:MAG TPA: alginate lyase family protein, partial [Lacipirellulaceae bacterium]|nr:alginate lyase family protein [Lacipirellulaceae bacterium]
WPNPDTADGLPYIRRDGETNHELRAQGDRDRLSKMIDDVETLALGHYLLGRSDYAAHAAKLLRAWFLDDATRMNPHLRYAQAIPGVNQGRGSGIIDARGFVKFLDAIALLHHAGGLEESDMQGLRQWFQSYAKWLLTSEPGRKERAAKNNHGNWYAAQAARVALFVGDESTARELIEDARDNRLPHAIDGDGRQPEELTRTRSLHYSLFSLEAFACLARFGEALGIDLWGHRAEDGASIDSALAYVTPYVLDQEAWPYEQIHDYRLSPDIISFLRMADARYDNPLYARVIRDAPRSNRDRVYAPLLFEGGETRR